MGTLDPKQISDKNFRGVPGRPIQKLHECAPHRNTPSSALTFPGRAPPTTLAQKIDIWNGLNTGKTSGVDSEGFNRGVPSSPIAGADGTFTASDGTIMGFSRWSREFQE